MSVKERRSDRIPWGRIAAEGAAIVVGILLAFAIDAWWDAKQDRKAEEVHLDALRVEFIDVAGLVAAELDQLEAAADTTRWLLSLSPDEAMAVGESTIADALVVIFRLGRLNLSSGALDALMASGRLGLLSDPELTEQLAAWPAALAEVYENASWLVESQEQRLVPTIHRYAGGLWTARRSGLLEDFPATRFAPQIGPMFSDSRLESALANQAVRIRVTQDRYEQLAHRAGSILALIDASLAGDAG